MIGRSVIKNQQIKSPLANTKAMGPTRQKSHKSLAMTLSLTSLVDAFSILVIYLLVNTSTSSETLNVSKDMVLPMAAKAQALESGPVLKIENGRYYLNEKEIKLSQLSDSLAQLQPNESKVKGEDEKRPTLTIQADRRTNFQTLSPIIRSSSQVGFYTIKFAVVSEEAI